MQCYKAPTKAIRLMTLDAEIGYVCVNLLDVVGCVGLEVGTVLMGV